MVRLSFDTHLWERGIRSGQVDPGVREEIRRLLGLELVALLGEGRDVVLDFSFWSRAMREEWRGLLAEHGVVPETTHLATDRETVLARVAERRGEHADDFPVDLDTAAAYVDGFEAPTPEEGPLTIVVDGEEFAARTDGPGAYHYDWVSGPNRGYGFSSFTNDRSSLPAGRHAGSIRGFLGMIDPDTGYIAEDPEGTDESR